MSAYSDYYQVEKSARKLELSATIGEGFEVAISGKQQCGSSWNKEKNGSDYFLKDMYDLSLDLSGNDGNRIGTVKVELPGLEVELGNGWFSAKTDYGWKTYVEYDAPKVWKKKVIEEER